MYAIKNEEEDRLFIEKSSIIKRMKPTDVMTYLGISEKFMIFEHLNHTQRNSILGIDNTKYMSAQRESIDIFRHSKDHDMSQFESQRSETTPINGGAAIIENSIFNNSSTSSSIHSNPFATPI